MIELYEREKIIFETRRHWYVLFVESLVFLLLALIPFFSFPFIASSNFFLAHENALALYFFTAFVWLLLLWVLFFVVWTNYYLDVWVITDRRVVSVEQHGLFSREVAECGLDRVQDIAVEVKGILATLLRFGDVHVQTAGESREFVFRDVAHPEKIKEIVFRECTMFLRREREDKSTTADQKADAKN